MPENYTRQNAKRVVPTELNSAHTIVSDEDEDRAPNFLVLPSGDGANRVLLAGVVTDIQDVGTDNEYFRMECNDVAGGRFFAYAGQYQPEAKATMKALSAPAFVSVIGKPRTYETDEGDVRVSIRPEVIQTIDQSEYLSLLAEAADHTIERLTGERGSDRFRGMADTMHDDETRRDIYEAAVETLEEVHEAVAGEEAEDDTLSREDLEAKEYSELRSLASEFEDISGNAAADTLIDELEGQPVPA